jgi:hypothetical protein
MGAATQAAQENQAQKTSGLLYTAGADRVSGVVFVAGGFLDDVLRNKIKFERLKVSGFEGSSI